MTARWPAILTPKLMREYLSCKSDGTLSRRLKVLSTAGLPPKDEALGGWWIEEVDQAIRNRRGSNANIDDGSEWLEAAK